MSEYIERGAVLTVLCRVCSTGGQCEKKCVDYKEMTDLPAADVVEVKHGRWEKYIPTFGVGDFIKCSVCDRSRVNNLTERTPYCPNCGAKMDGEV